MRGLPSERIDVPPITLQYWDYRDEMSSYSRIVFKGKWICIPKTMRAKMLNMIHSSHMCIAKRKQRARDLIFWPVMNGQIEAIVNKCSACREHQNKQQKEPMTIHEVPDLPWNKVGCDLFELEDKHFMIMVAY